MRINIFLIFCAVSAATCEEFIPAEWAQAESPLTLPIYSEFFDQVQQGPNQRSGRITRGTPASLGQFPYQALLYISPNAFKSTYMCGGVVISSQYILTAAHCLYQMTNAKVYAGLINRVSGPAEWGVTVDRSRLFVHESYNPTTITNDIALINAGSIRLSKNIQPIAIPTANDAAVSLVQKLAVVSGWGVVSDRTGASATFLQYIQATIVSNSNCVMYFGSKSVTDANVCLDSSGGRSACNGDSGGPLTTTLNGRKVVVGVVSFGAAIGCELGYPDVFTRVSSHLSWIKRKTGL